MARLCVALLLLSGVAAALGDAPEAHATAAAGAALRDATLWRQQPSARHLPVRRWLAAPQGAACDPRAAPSPPATVALAPSISAAADPRQVTVRWQRQPGDAACVASYT